MDASTQAAQRAIAQAIQSPFVLGLALTESIALFGLVLGRVGAPLVQIAPSSWSGG